MTNNQPEIFCTPMPRPSTHADQSLLASGRTLYAAHGSAGLSVRRVAEHAGVRPGLFHYHFESKDAFLAAVLQGLYEDAYAAMRAVADGPGVAVERLRAVLSLLGRILREQGPVIARIAADVAHGEPAPTAFVRANAPRHLALLTGLMAAAEQEGAIAPMPPLRRMGFVMGAVAAPLIAGRGLLALQPEHPLLSQLVPDVLSAEATEARIDMALRALRAGKESP